MIVFQISSEVNSGSVGRIAEQIGEQVLENEWKSYIAFGRDNLPSKSKTIKIGNRLNLIKHVLLTRLTDHHGFGSQKPTENLINEIKKIKPNIIHLQHMHGYFINIKILFNFLAKANIPVVWTFHDCWSFTGHCAYYEFVDCQKWKTECYNCPQTQEYPKSWLIDRSRKNFKEKKDLFTSVKNLTIIPVSKWLEGEVKKSFLKDIPIHTIQNGIDLEKFYPIDSRKTIELKYNLKNKKILLGVASTWEPRKGLQYFFNLAESLEIEKYQIILVGLDKDQLKNLPKNIIGLQRTESIKQLSELYSAADVFVNPTLEDTFPTTNLEAMACGTPVITFKTGGSVESVDENVGLVVEKANILKLIEAIEIITSQNKNFFRKNCREKAEKNYNKHEKFREYISLYKNLIEINELK